MIHHQEFTASMIHMTTRILGPKCLIVLLLFEIDDLSPPEATFEQPIAAPTNIFCIPACQVVDRTLTFDQFHPHIQPTFLK